MMSAVIKYMSFTFKITKLIRVSYVNKHVFKQDYIFYNCFSTSLVNIKQRLLYSKFAKLFQLKSYSHGTKRHLLHVLRQIVPGCILTSGQLQSFNLISTKIYNKSRNATWTSPLQTFSRIMLVILT